MGLTTPSLMARKKAEKPTAVAYDLKLQPFNPNKPEKWGMKVAVPRSAPKAVVVQSFYPKGGTTSTATLRRVEAEKLQHLAIKKKGKPPPGWRHKTGGPYNPKA